MEKTNKLLPIKILEILNNHSNKDNKINQEEILEYLSMEGYEISRRTLTSYIIELRDSGYIEGVRGVYRKDLFTERELRVLIDGIMYGKHIPKDDAEKLISKLKELSFNTMKNKALNLTYLPNINRTKNTYLYDLLDTIDEAINSNFKIEITQYKKGINKIDEKKSEIIDPYFVVTDQSRYYILGISSYKDKLYFVNRRVDRISRIEIVKNKRTPLYEVVGDNFDLGKYMQEHVYMFSGDVGKVRIKLDINRIGDFEDWCGTDYKVYDYDENNVVIVINTNYNAVYYWCLQYGEIAEVLEPKELRERIKTGLKNILVKYEGD